MVSKYCYVIPINQFLYTVKQFQVFQSNMNNSIKNCLPTVKWFHVLLCNTNNST